ncbi:MAG: YbfB/YjiJ family MFS transporter [Alcaligenes sp.]
MRRATAVHEPNWRPAIEAALVMAIGMGFGRFAFTAIYPHMVEENLLSLRDGSLAASANYAGYLLGALLAFRLRARTAHRLCLWASAGTAACLAVLGAVESVAIILAVRGLAGVFSALAIVAASLWLLERQQQMHRAPLLYAGVGLGIALSSELLAAGAGAGLDSKALWLLLGAVSAAMSAAIAPGLLSGAAPGRTTRLAAAQTPPPVRPGPLVAIYGLAGFGYIITATYLPLLARAALPELDAAHVWAVFGLGAAPSCFLWHRLHMRLGTRSALATNLGAQALGVMLPVAAHHAAAYLLSALLVGGTFMGTVTIAMPAARLADQARGNLMAAMTLVYGIGQIVGPMAANALFAVNGTLDGSLWAAGAALLAGVAISLRRL